MTNNTTGTRYQFAGLGIPAGAAIGLLVGLLTPVALTLAVGAGAAIGLLAGAMVDLRRA